VLAPPLPITVSAALCSDRIKTGSVLGFIKYTKQAMCVKCDFEARSRNHCCRGKAISIKY
jgi:hypothetical protein